MYEFDWLAIAVVAHADAGMIGVFNVTAEEPSPGGQ